MPFLSSRRLSAPARVFALAMALMLSALRGAAAPEGYELLPDSSNFVKASLIVSTPGEQVYSSLGHASIRLECPMHDLDYCFSFLIDDDTYGILNFFTGEVEGNIMAVTTPEYLKPYIDQGRGVEQYELNLTLHEKQRLWMLLDQNIVRPEYRRFNFAYNNCASAVIMSLEDSMMDGDTLKFGWPDHLTGPTNATAIYYISRDAPWPQFLFHLLFGSEGDRKWHNSHRMSPELLVPLFEASTIVNGGSSRPLLTGDHITIAPVVKEYNPSWLTPNVTFAAILALVILISLGQWLWGWVKVPRIMDFALLAAQTAAGIALLYVTLHTGLFGKHWNWMLIPLNPLPLVAWLLWRRRRWWYRLYLAYAVALWAFIAAGAIWLTTIILPLLLLTAILAARCTAKYLLMKKDRK